MTKEGVMTGIQVTFIPALSLFMITRLIAGNKVININDNAGIKVTWMPVMTPSLVKGTITFLKVVKGLAPKSLELYLYTIYDSTDI
jgi:hypothetical protein